MNFNNIKRAALLLLAGVSIACSEGLDETAEVSIPQEEAPIFSAEIINQPTDESRAYVNDEEDYYVFWEADDEISVFLKGSGQPSPYILATGAGNTTATFKANGTVYNGNKKYNCAVYPKNDGASLSTVTLGGQDVYVINYPMPDVQYYKKDRYAGLEPRMLAHCIEDEKFKFRSFTGYLALKLYTNETTDVRIKSVKLVTSEKQPISGTMTIGANEELTGETGGTISTGTSSITLDCGEGVKLSPNKSTPTLFAFALPVNARESDGTGGYAGLTFTVTDTQGRTMELTTNRNIGVTRGRITTMAPKAYEPKPIEEAIDLSLAPDGTIKPSNCYVVPGPGRYKFPTRHVDTSMIERFDKNKTEFETPLYDAIASYDEWGWMWRTDASIELSDMSYDPKTRYFSFTIKEENYKPGSISIVARDKNGRDVGFIHNWHLWLVSDLGEIEVKGYNGKNYKLLDRNIGAIKSDIGATSATDPDRFGLLYQWGCKDPKYNRHVNTINGEPEVNTYWSQYSEYPTLLQNWQFDGHWCGWESRNNFPLTIGSGHSQGTGQYKRDDYNWLQYFNTVQYVWMIEDYYWANTLWDSSKTNYDPCPVGWRVPTQAEITNLTLNAEYYYNATGWTLTDGTTVTLPVQKYVSQTGATKTVYNFNTYTDNAGLWTSTYVKYCAYMYCPSDEYSYNSNRSCAYPVRCIEDR